MQRIWTAAEWRAYFEHNQAHLLSIPWNDSYRLTAGEIEAVATSMQEFQLGEGSDGRHFLRLAEAYAARAGDHDYVDALRLFIAEEQRHSRDLGRFLQRSGIPLLQRHWTDSVFRRLRRLLRLDTCITVLVTAEIIARVYYQALRGATASPVLRRLCDQILSDEAAHVAFQCSMLNTLRRDKPAAVRSAAAWIQRAFMLCTMGVVWLQHRHVYQASGYSLFRYAGETLIELEKALAVVRDPSQALAILAPQGATRPAAYRFWRTRGLSFSMPLRVADEY